jgi:hypothetical protein
MDQTRKVFEPELVAETIEKMTKAEKRELYRTTNGDRHQEGPKTIYLSAKRRQRFQRLKIVHRPDLRGNHIMEMECVLTLLGEEIARTLAEIRNKEVDRCL